MPSFGPPQCRWKSLRYEVRWRKLPLSERAAIAASSPHRSNATPLPLSRETCSSGVSMGFRPPNSRTPASTPQAVYFLVPSITGFYPSAPTFGTPRSRFGDTAILAHPSQALFCASCAAIGSDMGSGLAPPRTRAQGPALGDPPSPAGPATRFHEGPRPAAAQGGYPRFGLRFTASSLR